MIIVCPACQARYKFDEAKLGERPKARTRCAKCGGSIEIENPALGAMTLPPGPPPPAPPAPEAADKTDRTKPSPPGAEVGSDTDRTGMDLGKAAALELPKDKRYSLAVIQGASTGQIFPVEKARTVIGRSGADVNLGDPEASRQHAVLEVFGDTAVLRDLGSTNGTFVDQERIEQKTLHNQTEFRIGGHVLMFIVTGRE